ncbi:MAG: TonB family protein [Deltaproteobacteria bacterium]|nr:TonB family protein [Deltaproteobacteria bacterium]
MGRTSRRFRHSLKWSFVVHVGLFLFLFFWGAHVPTPTPPFPVDVVMIDLPKGPSKTLGLGTLENPEEPDKPGEVAIPKGTPPPPISEEDLNALIKRLDEPSQDKKPAERPKKPPEKPAEKKTPPKSVAQATKSPAATPTKPASERDKLLNMVDNLSRKGSGGARGANSPGWEGGTGGKPLAQITPAHILNQYRAQVRAKILRQWAKPAQITALPPAKRPQAIVSLRINASGAIISRGWAKQSGNSFLDDSAMRAVNRASPLPAPPAEIKQMVLNEVFHVTFKP